MIQPWDKSSIVDIEKSIMSSDLGLMPNNDGNVIRISIPQLTEERRRDLVKLVRKKIEEGHIAIRNIRRDGIEILRVMEKQKEISKDELRYGQDDLQKVTDARTSEMDTLGSAKEAEVMEV